MRWVWEWLKSREGDSLGALEGHLPVLATSSIDPMPWFLTSFCFSSGIWYNVLSKGMGKGVAGIMGTKFIMKELLLPS